MGQGTRSLPFRLSGKKPVPFTVGGLFAGIATVFLIVSTINCQWRSAVFTVFHGSILSTQYGRNVTISVRNIYTMQGTGGLTGAPILWCPVCVVQADCLDCESVGIKSASNISRKVDTNAVSRRLKLTGNSLQCGIDSRIG